VDVAARTPLIVADDAERIKLNLYGDVGAHRVLPFAIEMSEALGRSATAFFRGCTIEAYRDEFGVPWDPRLRTLGDGQQG